jgi:hypothetical protein
VRPLLACTLVHNDPLFGCMELHHSSPHSIALPPCVAVRRAFPWVCGGPAC